MPFLEYSLDIPSSLKVEHSRGPAANYASSGYETLITGMTSPRSMNSGMGGSNTSGNSSSNNSGPNLTSRFIPPNMAALSDNHNNNNNNNNNGSSNNDNSNAKDSIDTIHGGRSSSRSSSTNKIIPSQPIIRGTSISSNEDSESVQSDSTAPKRKYRRHAKPDRNAPIKPPSAYIMFSNDSRAKLKDQNLSFAELAKVVGEQWKNLSYYEKQAYERKAMRAKDEYLAALERYRETDEYKRYQQYLKEFKAKQESANRLIDRARKRAKQKSPGRYISIKVNFEQYLNLFFFLSFFVAEVLLTQALMVTARAMAVQVVRAITMIKIACNLCLKQRVYRLIVRI